MVHYNDDNNDCINNNDNTNDDDDDNNKNNNNNDSNNTITITSTITIITYLYHSLIIFMVLSLPLRQYFHYSSAGEVILNNIKRKVKAQTIIRCEFYNRSTPAQHDPYHE